MATILAPRDNKIQKTNVITFENLYQRLVCDDISCNSMNCGSMVMAECDAITTRTDVLDNLSGQPNIQVLSDLDASGHSIQCSQLKTNVIQGLTGVNIQVLNDIDATGRTITCSKLVYEELDPAIIGSQTYAQAGKPSQVFGNQGDWYINIDDQESVTGSDNRTDLGSNYKKLLYPDLVNRPQFAGTTYSVANEAQFDNALTLITGGDIIQLTADITFTTSKSTGTRVLIKCPDGVVRKTITSTASPIFTDSGSICFENVILNHNVASTGTQSIIATTNTAGIGKFYHNCDFIVSEFGVVCSTNSQSFQFTNCRFEYRGAPVANNHAFILCQGMAGLLLDGCQFVNSNDLVSGRSRWIQMTNSGILTYNGDLRVSNCVDITDNTLGVGRQCLIYESCAVGVGLTHSLYFFQNTLKQFSGGQVILFFGTPLSSIRNIVAYGNTYANNNGKGLIALDNGSPTTSGALTRGFFSKINSNVAGSKTYAPTYISLITGFADENDNALEITLNTATILTYILVVPLTLALGAEWVKQQSSNTVQCEALLSSNVGQLPTFFTNAGASIGTPLPNGTYCYMKYPTTFTDVNFFVSYTNNARLNIRNSGVYTMSWTLSSGSSMHGFAVISRNLGNDNELTVFQNGNNFIAGEQVTGRQYAQVSTTARFNGGDYINLLFYTTSGGGFNPVDYNNRFSIIRVA
jgi:hypothetical protein